MMSKTVCYLIFPSSAWSEIYIHQPVGDNMLYFDILK